MNNQNKSVSPEKAFFYGIGALAVGGAIYYTAKTILQKKEDPDALEPETAAVTTIKKSAKKLPAGNDEFPLKYGSMGLRVRQLQTALQRILGEAVMSQYTKVDGDFRDGTEGALKAAKLPTVIDETTFNRLTAGVLVPTLANPQQIGTKLYEAAKEKNFDAVIAHLRMLNSVADYSAANNSFKGLQLFSVAKSIVTYLLDDAFASNAASKEALRTEFLRIGLKSSASDPIHQEGKWSLSGIRRFKDLITLVDTYVVFGDKHIPVTKNTILGEETAISNGMTYFKAIDQKEYAAPTAHIKYVS
jgi:hypothetical protein